MYILLILGADLKKVKPEMFLRILIFVRVLKKIMRFRATRRYLALK